ncbi:hypothetical protein BDN72DRAFT_878756 [Pluteus cervinus]|uniref:Uncharacterized protein n=1 Tax=Pluteus cervinus TaxID=181527 RepID=A0ACD3AUB3_9AGAR|nr:hypothetical protein BDN72DRAFT_878756 [Pluteus cervinus]
MSMEKWRAMFAQNSDLYDPTAMGQDLKYGHIKGFPPGSLFEKRKELQKNAVHNQSVAGISGSPQTGTCSIVISGGYEDDLDAGDVLEYTGTGGQDDSYSNPGPQTSDQSWEHPHNGSLLRSFETKRPVRVIRGTNSKSPYAPLSGYRYDGLYIVTKAYMAKGKSGYKVCKVKLERMSGQPPLINASSQDISEEVE